MDKRYSRIIENSKGEGKIFEDSIFVDTVYYRFQVSQEFILSETHDGSQSIPGIKRLSGVIKLQNITLDILGKYFKLELSDKKTWNILISSCDFTKGEYEFVLGPGN